MLEYLENKSRNIYFSARKSCIFNYYLTKFAQSICKCYGYSILVFIMFLILWVV